MNRRVFTKMAGLAFAAVSTPFVLVGCKAQTYISILVGAVQSILTYVGGPLAAQISSALTKVQADVAAWTTGTIPQVVVEALNDLQGLLDQVPLSSLVTTLVSIAITAVDAILSASGGNASVSAKTAKPRAHATPSMSLTTAHEFGRAWNESVELSGLPASIKVHVGLFQ
jgi:hypothetical protein